MPHFFVVVPLGVLVPLAWLVLAKKAYENPTCFYEQGGTRHRPWWLVAARSNLDLF